MTVHEEFRRDILLLWRWALLVLIVPVALLLLALLIAGWGADKALDVLFSRLG